VSKAGAKEECQADSQLFFGKQNSQQLSQQAGRQTDQPHNTFIQSIQIPVKVHHSVFAHIILLRAVPASP
jgi:hypothetical protein